MAATKTLRRILERIRDDAQQALSVLGESEERRSFPTRLTRKSGVVASQKWQGKQAGLSKGFCANTLPVASLLKKTNEC
jgi:hypothetical protein